MKFEKYFFFKSLILILIITSFFIGYDQRDYAPGGAMVDFNDRIWPTLESFKTDLLFSINNYGSFQEGSYPLFYIINAYLNPFISNQEEFLLSVTIISFIVFIFFALLINKNFQQISKLDSFLISSSILLLPFYRTSAYWGSNENFGWLFFVLSIYFFLNVKNYKNADKKIKTIDITLFCFFSACALYIRPALVFLPMVYLLYLLFDNKKNDFFVASILYFIFSIPGFILIYKWGGLHDTNNWGSNYILDHHSYKYILKNTPILLSYFAFYFLPIVFIEYLNIGFKNFISKYTKVFLTTLIAMLFFWQLNFLNYLGEYTYGGGAILKLNYLLSSKNYFLLIISAVLGFTILYEILKENFKKNIIIILPIFIIYGFPKYLFQEYLEPLIFFIFFSGFLYTDLYKFYLHNILRSNIIIFLYFGLYLLASTYYKYYI